MITPIAPAFWAFFTLMVKPQVPRSISAILPATWAPLDSGEQPSVVLGPAASAASCDRATTPLKLLVVSAGPKPAVP